MEKENQGLVDWSEIALVDDLFTLDLCCLEGLGELLSDLGRACDIPGDPVKTADISIEALFSVEYSIKTVVERLRATLGRIQGDLNASGVFGLLKAFHARRSGAGAPVAGPPAFPSVALSGAATGGVHMPQEVEDLGHELDLVYQALSGMQANAKINETESEDFDHPLIFMQNMKDRLERISGALDRLISPARLDQGSVAKTEPARRGEKPAAPRRAPAARGNRREALPARA